MKNIVLIVIAVAAIGGAIYGISQAGGSGGTVDTNQMKYFTLASAVGPNNTTGVEMTLAEFQKRVRNGPKIEINGVTEDVIEAGKCPQGFYYGLEGHGGMPAVCGCGDSLAGFDRHGNPI
ncbi:MAG: hypothetical protein AAFR96_09235 [Planctomycetota bacterium]